MEEGDVEEPRSAVVGLDWLPIGRAGSDDGVSPYDGGLSPFEIPGLGVALGTNAITLMDWFGNREAAPHRPPRQPGWHIYMDCPRCGRG